MAMTAENLRGPLRFTIDLTNGLIQQTIRPQLMKGDKRANTIIVALTEDKKPIDLSGVTVTGSFISPVGGAEIPLAGSVNGNEAHVTLIDECYAEEGYFEANVKLTTGETSRTILSITGHVLSKGKGAVIDIGDVIPSIDDIIAQYATMKQVTKDAQDAANAASEAAAAIDGLTVSAEEADEAGVTVSEVGGVKHISFALPRGPEGPQGPPGTNGTGSGTVTGIQIGGETYQPDEAGVVALPDMGGGVPDGGTKGQMIFKTGNEDRAAEWDTPTHDKVGALGSDPREGGEETPDMQAVPINADQLGGMTYQQIIDMIYPIGRTITTLADEDDPNALYPWQTWERAAQGRMLIGTGAPENNDDGSIPGEYNYAARSKGGEEKHTLTSAEVPKTKVQADKYSNAAAADTGSSYIDDDQFFFAVARKLQTTVFDSMVSGSDTTIGGSVQEYGELYVQGGGAPHNNMPPYIAANIWRRTA